MILNCFIKWCSMNRVIFCLIDALKNARPENFFIIAICDFFCHCLFDTSIKGKKISKKKNLCNSFLKSCFSLTETVVILIRLAQHLLGHFQAKIMNALGMKQVYMIVQITKNSVQQYQRNSAQGPNLDVNVRRIEYITIYTTVLFFYSSLMQHQTPIKYRYSLLFTNNGFFL